MGYANYIGRVGALAVALGIGAAVTALPNVAMAEETNTSTGSPSPSDSGGTQQQSEQSPEPPSNEPAGDPKASLGGDSTPVIGSSKGALTSDADEELGDDGDLEGDEQTEGEEETEVVELPDDTVDSTQNPTPTGTPEQPGSGSTTEDASPQSNTNIGPSTAQTAPGGEKHEISVPLSGTNGQEADARFLSTTDDSTTRSLDSAAAFASLANQPLAATATAGPPDPVSSLLAIPGAIIVAVVDTVVNLFQPIVGPGAPLDNAFLWGLLAWTQRNSWNTFANRSPEIGADEISLTVDGDSADNSIGLLPSSDADGNPITYAVDPANGPANGTVAINGNTVTYTPNAGFSGTDSFVLVASDAASGFHIHGLGQSHTDTALVRVTVEATGRPVAGNDSGTVVEGDAVTIDVLANDTDPDGTIDPETVVITGQTNGTAVVNADGTVTFTSNGGEAGTAGFTYTVNDNDGKTSNVATVALTVTPVDDAPTAVNDTANTESNTPVNINVLANDTDVDGGPKLIGAVTQGTEGGTVTITGDGTGVTYTPDEGFVGTDTFTYTLNGGSVATVTVTVTVNTPPVANPDSGVVVEGGSVTVNVLGNDTDPDGTLNPGTVTIVTQTNGTAVVNADGTVTFTSDGGEAGTAGFTYTVTDNEGATSNVATVTLTVTPVDDRPIAVNDSATTAPGTPVTIAVLTNDTDVDGGPKTITSVSQPANGTTAITNGGTTIQFTPVAGFTGSTSFTYTLNGGSVATVNVNVVNNAPNTVIETVDVGENPVAVSVTPDGTRVYVANLGNPFTETGGSITVIDMSDPNNPTVLTTIELEEGINPRGVAVSPTGRHAYVTFDNVVDGNGHLLVIDTDPTSASYNTVIGAPIEVGDGPSDITFSPDGKRAFILNASSINVSVFDVDPTSPTFHQVIGGRIPVGNSSQSSQAVTPDGTRLYSTPSQRQVTVVNVDPASAGYGGQIGSPIALPESPGGIAVSPDGQRVYVTLPVRDSIAVIDSNPASPTYNTIIQEITGVGDLPLSVIFSPDGARAYVGNGLANRVAVIDTDPNSATYNTVLTTIAVGDRPDALAVSADGTRLYVANNDDASVSVIRIAPVGLIP